MDLRDHNLRQLEEMLTDARDRNSYEDLISALENDPRKGAVNLARKARKKLDRARRQEARWRAFCDPERHLWQKGYDLVAGVDEAGRGPLAGPVVAAAVILPEDFVHHPLDDSKRMTRSERQKACEAVQAAARSWAVGIASVGEIDRHNILGAVHQAVERALTSLDPPADFALVDGRPLTSCPVPHQAIVRGDSRSRVIAAASVIAKVRRDGMMIELDEQYPGYGFASHKGYATARHFEALRRLGPSPVHRRSFLKTDPQLSLSPAYDVQSPHEWGERAEGLVAADYESRGYTVVGRRWRGGGGELDLVCRLEDEIVMVEIKSARSSRAGPPLAWLSEAQRRRWRAAAAAYLRGMDSKGRGLRLRFDLVGVVARRSGPPELMRVEGIEP